MTARGESDEQAATYRVTLQFEKDGPSSSGWWTSAIHASHPAGRNPQHPA